MKVPEGFTPIFNGKDLTGWHVSRSNIHGTTPDFHVLHGVLVGTQRPLGSGGILITDEVQETSSCTWKSIRTGAATAVSFFARPKPELPIRLRSITCRPASSAT